MPLYSAMFSCRSNVLVPFKNCNLEIEPVPWKYAIDLRFFN